MKPGEYIVRAMTPEAIANLLKDAEKAHAASGDPAEGWAAWYAMYIYDHTVVYGVIE